MKLGKWDALIHKVERLCGEVETVGHQIEQIWVQLGRPFLSNHPSSVTLPSNDWAWIAWGVFTVYDVCTFLKSSGLGVVQQEIERRVEEVGTKPKWLCQGMLDYSQWVKDNNVDLASMRGLAITLQRLAEDKERPRDISNDSFLPNAPAPSPVPQQKNNSEVGDSTGFLPSDLLPSVPFSRLPTSNSNPAALPISNNNVKKHDSLSDRSDGTPINNRDDPKTLKDVRISPGDVTSVSDAKSTTSATKQPQVKLSPTQTAPKSPAQPVSKPRASTPSPRVKPVPVAPKSPAQPVSRPRASTPSPRVKPVPVVPKSPTRSVSRPRASTPSPRVKPVPVVPKSPARLVNKPRASTPSPRVKPVPVVPKSPTRSVSKTRASQSPRVKSTSRGVSPAPSSRGRSASMKSTSRIKKKK